MTSDEILDELIKLFPQAHCELNYRSLYELTVAVILSAQTTDVAVNQVTPALFQAYPSFFALAEVAVEQVEVLINSLGLFRNKARNLVQLARVVEASWQGTLPPVKAELIKLPGIGPKSANVILSEYFKIPAIAVDTHVFRVAKRLRLATASANVAEVEQQLNQAIKKERWNHAHHLFIFFGRYQCFARNPACTGCPFRGFCAYWQ